jgi:integrase
MNRWDQSAPATWNKHLAALHSLAAYSRRQEWIRADPARHLERRKTTGRGDKAIPAARLDKLFTDDRNGLRERVLWRMVYETAARAEEVLTLDVTDLDPQFRRALTRWAATLSTCTGPPPPPASCRGCWPGARPARCSWPTAAHRLPARARALADVDPATGRGRLSYPRAEYLFKHASLLHDPHGAGWTLHQLRHSALKHLAASGRTAPELEAKSRHKHLG